MQLVGFNPVTTPQGAINSQAPEWGDDTAMTTLAATLVANTQSFITQLGTAANGIFAPVVVPNFPTITSPPTPGTIPQPALINVAWNTPAQPAAFAGTLNVDNIMPGPFQGIAPTLNFGAAPASFSQVAPASPSVNTNFAYPVVAPISLPSAPNLLGINTVTFNPLAIPTFNLSVPTLTLSPPNAFSYAEKTFYTSTELTLVQSSLSAAMTNGTFTALDTQTMDGIFSAAYEKEYRTQANAIAELNRMESLGYAFPPGAFLDSRIKIQTETANTMAGLSRDIMVQQSKLSLDNVMKSRELAITLESRLIDYYNSICQRAFDSAKYAVESAIAIYNAQAEIFKAQLEGYRVQAEVYDTQIKGIMAQVEQTKAQIDFERTKAEIDKTLVDAYQSQINAQLAILQVYKVETDIIQVQAQVEKLKVETFAAQIQAFTGEVQAYTAQVEAYKAGIEAQATQEQAYKTSVDAYTAQVEAAAKVMDVQIAEYRAQIEAYTAQLDGYKASLQAMTEQARSASLYNEAGVEVYKGEVQAITSYNDTLTKQWEAVLNEQEKIAEVGVKAAEANGQLYISARQLAIDAAKAGAQVAAQLGAAALGSIHWNNSTSWNLSTSLSESSSSSTSTSTSNNTNINESV